jgi:hypothetical protein
VARVVLVILFILLLGRDNILGSDTSPFLYQSYLGLNIAKMLIVFMFPFLFYVRNWLVTKIDLIFALGLFLGITVGLIFGHAKLIYVSNDIGVIITIWTGYSFYKVLHVYNVFNLLALVGIVFGTIAIYNYFNGIGELVGTHRRPLLDSGRNIITLSFLYSLIMLREKVSVKWVIFAVISIISIALIGSRGQLVLTALPLTLYVTYAGSGLILSSVFLSLIIWLAIERTNEGLISFLRWKLTSFTIFDIKGRITSTGARYFEFINLYAEMAKDWTLYFGRGVGGYFTDKYYPFMAALKGKDAYDITQIRLREISNPHGFQFWLLLKFGLVTFSYLFFRVTRSFFTSNVRKKVIIFLAVFCFYKSFTLKMQLVSGIFLGLAIDE